MARDLVTEGVQVHDMAGTVRDYWFALSREAPVRPDAGPIAGRLERGAGERPRGRPTVHKIRTS